MVTEFFNEGHLFVLNPFVKFESVMITEFYNHFKMIKPDVQEMHTNLGVGYLRGSFLNDILIVVFLYY